jgi:thiosulfate/3-mercaptopyruvate sulfurtransferase
MSLQCTACHGSRIGEEYTGAHQGLRSDVHYVPNAMHCKNCHTGEQIHGDGTEYAHRYENASLTRCRDCHHIGAENGYHATHGSEFACQVCHSQDYKNCNDCHAGSGLQEPSYLQFKIGRNPISELRSGSIAVLRHVPASEQTYSAWGVESSTYSSLPTFKYASPHNIVRWTSRTDTSGGQSCFNACHNTSNGPDGFFLRLSDLDTLSVAEREANLPYVVPDGPPPWN